MKQSNTGKKIILIGSGVLFLLGIVYFFLGIYLKQNTGFSSSYYFTSFILLWLMVFLLFNIYGIYSLKKEKAGIYTPINECMHVFTDYKYLLEQVLTFSLPV